MKSGGSGESQSRIVKWRGVTGVCCNNWLMMIIAGLPYISDGEGITLDFSFVIA
jgi:hypothetical protein